MRISTFPLTDADRRFFADEGYLYARRFLPAEAVLGLQMEIHRLLGIVLTREGLGSRHAPFSPEEF